MGESLEKLRAAWKQWKVYGEPPGQASVMEVDHLRANLKEAREGATFIVAEAAQELRDAQAGLQHAADRVTYFRSKALTRIGAGRLNAEKQLAKSRLDEEFARPDAARGARIEAFWKEAEDSKDPARQLATCEVLRAVVHRGIGLEEKTALNRVELAADRRRESLLMDERTMRAIEEFRQTEQACNAKVREVVSLADELMGMEMVTAGQELEKLTAAQPEVSPLEVRS